MGFLNEYIDRHMTTVDYQKELGRLIGEYNKIRGSYLFIFAADISKPIPDISICQKDYYTIFDMLSKAGHIKKIDVYLETPGGSGEAAEEIIKFFRGHFDDVCFVISGEAKSAGTIIALSGDDILMTETASLGPIDAQVRIGRSNISASDYVEWVTNKQKEAAETNALNPFDAVMIAQITPGELLYIENALEFAKDIVTAHLEKYKFKNWAVTEHKGETVTPERKRARAQEIANKLANHSEWRSHGRSIKREDLVKIGLKITNVEDDGKLSEIVHRIHTVLRLLFESSSVYKVFWNADNFIVRSAVSKDDAKIVPDKISVVEVDAVCEKCQKVFHLYGKFIKDPKVDIDMGKKGRRPFPKDCVLKCDCGFEIDLMGVVGEIESQAKKKLLL